MFIKGTLCSFSLSVLDMTKTEVRKLLTCTLVRHIFKTLPTLIGKTILLIFEILFVNFWGRFLNLLSISNNIYKNLYLANSAAFLVAFSSWISFLLTLNTTYSSCAILWRFSINLELSSFSFCSTNCTPLLKSVSCFEEFKDSLLLTIAREFYAELLVIQELEQKRSSTLETFRDKLLTSFQNGRALKMFAFCSFF